MLDKIYYKIKNSNRIDFFVICTFFVGIFSFLFFAGTLNSGYHFIDDHSMFSIQSSLIHSSFLQNTLDFTRSDFLIRFRPLYYLYYISTVKVFGINFFKISVFVGILAFLTFSFFYIGMRRLRHSYVESFIFVLLMFLGSQMAIWWRLGTNETIGVFFLGLSFLFMTKCLEKSNYKLNNVLFVVFLIITSLCKESFLITIPAFIMFKIWNEKRSFKITTKESLKNNKLLVLPIIIMFIELLIIKFYVGTNQIGYAGATSSIAEFIIGVKNIILNPDSLLYWMILLGALLLIYVVSFLFTSGGKKEEFTKSIKSLSIYLVFAIIIVGPQILMHAKSGMVERYLLPTTFGLAFLAIGIIQNTKEKIFKWFAILVACIFLTISFNAARKDAILFAESGKDANSLLTTIKNNVKPESKILLVADPANRYEVSYSIKRYLSFYGINNLYGYPVMREYRSDFEIGLKNTWLKWFENKSLQDIKNGPDIIIIFDKAQGDRFFNESQIKASEYENVLPESTQHFVYKKNRLFVK